MRPPHRARTPPAAPSSRRPVPTAPSTRRTRGHRGGHRSRPWRLSRLGRAGPVGARPVELAEKTLTLAIATRLRDLLEAEGIAVVMIRDERRGAGRRRLPAARLRGPPWRDVNGDGLAGFGPETCRRGPARATSCRRAWTSPTSPEPMRWSASTSTRRPRAGSASRSRSARPSTPMRRRGGRRPPRASREAIQAGVVGRLGPARDVRARGPRRHRPQLLHGRADRCSSRPRSGPTRSGSRRAAA